MNLRRTVGAQENNNLKLQDFEMTRLRYLSAMDKLLEQNANAQDLVIKVEHWNSNDIGSSVMLTGDCDAETFRYGILKDYSKNEVK